MQFFSDVASVTLLDNSEAWELSKSATAQLRTGR